MIAIDLSKKQALEVDPRANQQINFTANLDRAGNTRIYFILEEAKETKLDFSQGPVITNLRKAFANHTSTDIKLSKTQLSKMIQLGGFLGRLLGPLLKTGLPLLKSVIKL